MKQLFSGIKRIFGSVGRISRKTFNTATKGTGSFFITLGSAVAGVVTLITVLGIIFVIGLVAIPVGTFSVDVPTVVEVPA